MSDKRNCPACGREFDDSFRFCPFDASALQRPPEPAPPPEPPSTAPPVQPVTLSFIEEAGKSSWKSQLVRPSTIIFAAGTIAVISLAAYMAWRTSEPDLPPPAVSYSLLPNEGKSKGIPVAIKVNHLAVFMIDDPMEGGAATRAQQLVNVLTETIKKAKGESDVRFAVDTVNGRPAILEVTHDGPDQKTLASITEGDAALAGESDANRVAARWAERLTDAVKVYVFAQAPTFSTGTDFGDALSVLYRSASGGGKLTRRSLERAFQQLSEPQRKALETPPRNSRPS